MEMELIFPLAVEKGGGERLAPHSSILPAPPQRGERAGIQVQTRGRGRRDFLSLWGHSIKPRGCV